jgi:hypothetical protein
MTTPRVTEIPIALAAVEPDPFVEVPRRTSAARRRLVEREARERQAELVRRFMRVHAARPTTR